MKLADAALLFTLASASAWAQVNVGEQTPEASLPFTMTTVTTFKLPWRLAFQSDVLPRHADLPAMERQRLRQRPGDQIAQPHHI